MPSLKIELKAEMEDGTLHEVVADQRDISKWELQPFGCPFSEFSTRMFLALRWFAWHALYRQGRIELGWDEFDAQCVEVSDADDEEDGSPDDGLDPGLRAPSA